MNSLVGQGLILLALAAAASGSVVGYAAGRSGSAVGLAWTKRLTILFCGALVTANLVMEKALIEHDFTVKYVDQVGSTSTPFHITIVSLWSALEGSILFWGFILGIFTAGFVASTGRRHSDMVPYTLATILAVGTFFCFLIAGPANPFTEVIPRPDLHHTGPNPLLQNHALMIIHPPMLYLGYVGMTIPFAMGVAALLRGRLSPSWTRPMRRWMLLPFGFLTVGIVLGGWWAYEVLGWGGYWAWDPVENASFLPWLTAAAFLHAAMLRERRGLLASWTIVLLLATFALTILGTFMTRSGVFNSVHSFTQSAIGPTFLVFLAIVLVVSVVLVALRGHLLDRDGEMQSPLSRDSAFILNNLLFVAFTFTVLVGTVFPLVAEAARGVKLSVGGPFFNQLTVPIGVAIVFLMGVGPSLPWGRVTRSEAIQVLRVPLISGGVVWALAFALGIRQFWPAATFFVSGFAAAVSIRDMMRPALARRRAQNETLLSALRVSFARGRRRYGGHIVHLGVALMAVSIAVSSSYQQVAEGVVAQGETLELGPYSLRFEGSRSFSEPHREVAEAQFAVLRDGEVLATLAPRLNRYRGEMSPIGTPAVLTGPGADIYLSLMNIDGDGSRAGLRAYINPLVVWLWIAAGMMAMGVGVALWPERRTSPDPTAGSADPQDEAA